MSDQESTQRNDSPSTDHQKDESATNSENQEQSREASPELSVKQDEIDREETSDGQEYTKSKSAKEVSTSESKEKRRSRSRGKRTKSRSRSPRKMSGRSRYRSRSRSPRRRRRSRSASGSPARDSYSPMSGRRRHDGDRDDPKPNRCLGVFGLSVRTTEDELHSYFSKFGPVERIQVVIDAKTGRSRGFAFCYFESVEDAKIAKEQCSNIVIDGRHIRVDFSVTQRAHTPTPGIYMGKPTYVERDRDRDRDYGRSYGRDRYRDDYGGYGGGYGYRDRGYDRSYRRSPSPRYRNRRYDRSRSRSYSPRRY